MARTDLSKIIGRHNNDFDLSSGRILTSNSYRDLSTVWVTPSRDSRCDLQVVFQSWLSLIRPMNQKFLPLGINNAEVGDAYNAAVEMILRDPQGFKYMLTIETDNLPPRDGLMKLYENCDKFDVIGGLYWGKGEGGQAMIYGDPAKPGDFTPQVPKKDRLQECNGLGMGFTLFNVDMFRHIPKPWFKTVPETETTQDIHFFAKARAAGYKVACDTRVKVGHIDFNTREIW